MNDQHECPSKDNEIICNSNLATAPRPSQKEDERHKLGKHREEGSSSAAQMVTSSECATDYVQSTTVSCSNRRDSEAKRCLSRRLKNVGKSTESLSGKGTPRLTLKRILSSPKHGFMVSSCPTMETELHKRGFSTSTFQSFNEDICLQLKNEDVSTKLNYKGPEVLNILESDAQIHETGLLIKDWSSHASQKNLKVNDTIQSVSANLSEMPS